MTLHIADNLPLLWEMPSDSVDLVATDPPFATGRDWGAYDDRWQWDDKAEDALTMVDDGCPHAAALIRACLPSPARAAYLVWMAVRLVEMRRVLKPAGSLYLHCDPTASHYIKAVLDAVFGERQFRNEIVWCYRKWSNTARYFQRNTDAILFYSRTDAYTFHKPLGAMTPCMKQIRKRGWNGGSSDGLPRLSVYDREKAKRKIEEFTAKHGTDRLYFVDDAADGAPLPNWWDDIAPIKGNASQACGYPTQKPVALYERIIRASSDDGDIVLDPFCGSGTTLVAAKRLGRRWIGIDANADAIAIAEKRLAKELV